MNTKRLRVAALSAISSLVLAACGGGGGGSAPPPNPNNPPPPPVNQTPPTGNQIPGPRPTAGPRSYVLYESGQVRPLALSNDGTRLYATNTPDNRLEIFAVDATGLTHVESVPVGMEPVAVAEAGDGSIWVVNHLSDNISIVDVAQTPARVVRTLWVGDEPRDIVFAGNTKERAFVTTAHRGQNSPLDPQLRTAGVGRADLWVFDVANLGASAGGDSEAIVNLFADRARGLAVSPDGGTVYATNFMSGNRSTVLPPPNLPKSLPTQSADGVLQPDTGLIIRFDGQNWVDENFNTYDARVPFSLPDWDVFAIDADAATPIVSNQFNTVGTILFNLAVNPVTGDIYSSNIDSLNHIRFAGAPNIGNTSVRGRLAAHRITILDSGAKLHRDLNKHLDFTRATGTQAENDTSLSLPTDIAVSADGSTLYVAAFGSQKIGVFDTTELENDSFVPNASMQIELSAGGPSGIVLDGARNRAYALTRFDNGVSVIDTAALTEVSHLQMFNPEPAHIVSGRPFLYDARWSSSRGTESCGTCHIFGDNDSLAWDLGDPDGTVAGIPNTFIPISPAANPIRFHPMKGPMTTQSMRGIKGHGPMHWRGDRTGANRVGGETLEEAAFKQFNEAFVALMGRASQLSAAEMQMFTDFAMELSYPPNPIRPLDNSMTPDQAAGEILFNLGMVRQSTQLNEVCIQCHVLQPRNGLFGTSGLMSNNTQPGDKNFKIPHFRDFYQKVGMFGFGAQGAPIRGNQVRGFAYNHNGATTSNFILADLGAPADQTRQIREFLFAFPTESPPVTAQQVTLDDTNSTTVAGRIDLLMQQGLVTQPVPECELIVKGIVAGESRGWLMDANSQFISDRAAEAPLSRTDLDTIAQTAGQPLTFTCTPWGSGQRMGLDRDEDGVLDGDE